MRALQLIGITMITAAFGAACDDGGAGDPAAAGDLELDLGPEVPEAGKAMFEPALPPGAKEDSVTGRKGISTAYDNGSAQVWEVRNNWADTNTADAKKAGLAWPANSGLTWDEKFARWVQSMPKSEGQWGRSTFTVSTPYGKTLPGVSLECAEVAMFLRATFASWYGLPFYVEGSDSGKRIFLGHFGFLYEDGTRFRSTPAFKTAYRDWSSKAATWQRDGWPTDSTLRGRKLGGSQDDFQPALFEGARAGAYFDELYLNKRVGYFMFLLLGYFGSVNLADPSNTFNLDPKAIRAGDPLVKRWQRNGIGHVYVVKHVESIGDGQLSAEVVSGSMPRRQPVWESAASSQSAFTADYAGGPGENSDGHLYAALGGGLKRWRTPVAGGGRWTNIVPVADRAHFIDASDHTAIAGRIETFRQILGSLTPEEKRDTLLGQITAQRDHLRRYPASCSARTRREEAFDKLYALMADEWGMDKAAVDAEYRLLDDYVFAELEYTASKTCCWNSSTSAMYEIAMDKAMVDAGDADKACVEPAVFKATNGGYEIFRAHAELIGRAAEWRAWSDDEPCPQANVTDDKVKRDGGAGYCAIRDALDDDGPGLVPGHDAFEPNDASSAAAAVTVGQTVEGAMAQGDVDWFQVNIPSDGTLTVDLSFRHAEGDLDLALEGGTGAGLGTSTGSGDAEKVVAAVTAGVVRIKVHVYGSASSAQKYQLTTSFAPRGQVTTGPDRFEPNDTASAAKVVQAGTTSGLTQCGDADHFRVDVARGGGAVFAIAFRHAEGDLDLRILDSDGRKVGGAEGTTDAESAGLEVVPGSYTIEVLRYQGTPGGACQPYTLSVTLP